MKFLHLVDFQHVDPVRTEETVINNLKKTMFSLETKFVVADYAWAYSINRHGIDYTQDVVNMFLSRVSDQSTLIFICQHILVERLDWGGSVVFTPHSANSNRFHPIAHFSVSISTSNLLFNDRNILASFVGCNSTHPVRALLSSLLSTHSDCLTIDTGLWHFDKLDFHRTSSEDTYIRTLQNSKYVFCPRGTGPSTIRIWEALGSGCIPIVISDDLRLPSPLSDFIPLLPSSFISLLPNILVRLRASISDSMASILQARLAVLHDKYTSNHSLHAPIADYIKAYSGAS